MNYIVQMIRFLLIPLILCLSVLPSFSALRGGVDYKIPFDYTKLNQAELESKAEFYYNSSFGTKELNEEMTCALNLYSLLSNAYPENIAYALRLGELYDVLGKDRYAKGQYYRAMGVSPSRPEPYFYLGNFYYKREQYRKALKFFLKAYDLGYSEHYQTLEKIGTIYQKFGDTEKALYYFQCAVVLNPSDSLYARINSIKSADDINNEYYRN